MVKTEAAHEGGARWLQSTQGGRGTTTAPKVLACDPPRACTSGGPWGPRGAQSLLALVCRLPIPSLPRASFPAGTSTHCCCPGIARCGGGGGVPEQESSRRSCLQRAHEPPAVAGSSMSNSMPLVQGRKVKRIYFDLKLWFQVGQFFFKHKLFSRLLVLL